MPFDQPFEFVDENSLRRLLPNQRTAFLDVITFLHDLLSGDGSEPVPPRFENARQVREWLDILINGLSNAPAVHAATLTNRGTAFDLLQEVAAPTRTITSYQTRRYVDTYLDRLLEQYRTVRLMRP